MFAKVKKALRITHDALDDEIQDLIDAALVDLNISGVENIIKTDPLIIRAVTIYCKAHIGLSNTDSEKYELSYRMLKTHLALCEDYNEVF